MASDAERRLKELEEQVRAERAARVGREQAALTRARPTTPQPVPGVDVAPAPRKARFFTTWKRKLALIGGIVVAGALTLWVLEKLFRIALYVGAAAAIAFGVWWLLFRKKK
jgi:hypothetical protein